MTLKDIALDKAAGKIKGPARTPSSTHQIEDFLKTILPTTVEIDGAQAVLLAIDKYSFLIRQGSGTYLIYKAHIEQIKFTDDIARAIQAQI